MSVQHERLRERFSDKFENQGMKNIKFFVNPCIGVNREEFLDEVCDFEAAVASGAVTRVESIDIHLKTRRFDEAL